MSISLSATIAPSRCLLLATACMCVLVTGIVVCSVWSFGWQLSWHLFFRLLLIFVSLVLIAYRFMAFLNNRFSVKIDIAASGRIILRRFIKQSDAWQSYVVTMTDATTLWPHLLLLHLQSQDDQGRRIHIVPILPDCVDARTWRKLSVALRWIAIHQQAQKNTAAQPGNF
ncbi:protein YgfX [Undibacterium sp. 5I1]|uniref:protein YgfX n=1 Tax=unclassified Undibacterium TaxID=2630295 RepID=UPI002AB4AA67|nr:MULTISPECIES: protein YgfX [unclassified Undibacterium]MDY7538289.1 protein YgfX [Undibacterium sp. 5I1]